ncbi:hypothetical protein D9758_018699 [Tetrapyrgos nigripes]|uniref:Uncharacterized protein n=1 Tax=Tetrapyrgos nigripes TaxID=182062 RepID=A0A8H5BWP0_9AGAR|nr:hypothetical protein D9758_018699 [Tetrapyrgos nigripes]
MNAKLLAIFQLIAALSVAVPVSAAPLHRKAQRAEVEPLEPFLEFGEDAIAGRAELEPLAPFLEFGDDPAVAVKRAELEPLAPFLEFGDN